MTTNGRDEIKEAVVIAAVSAVVIGVINWGYEEAKAKLWYARKKRKKQEKKAKKCLISTPTI